MVFQSQIVEVMLNEFQTIFSQKQGEPALGPSRTLWGLSGKPPSFTSPGKNFPKHFSHFEHKDHLLLNPGSPGIELGICWLHDAPFNQCVINNPSRTWVELSRTLDWFETFDNSFVLLLRQQVKWNIFSWHFKNLISLLARTLPTNSRSSQNLVDL